MATFMPDVPQMNVCGQTLQLRLELFARGPAGERTDKRAQAVFAARVDLVVRVFASARSTLSPPLTPLPSSFGRDTLAHSER